MRLKVFKRVLYVKKILQASEISWPTPDSCFSINPNDFHSKPPKINTQKLQKSTLSISQKTIFTPSYKKHIFLNFVLVGTFFTYIFITSSSSFLLFFQIFYRLSSLNFLHKIFVFSCA